MSYQKLIVVGHVGQNCEMRYTPSGKPVASFSLATNHQYTNNNGEVVKETTWLRITTWGKLAEVCNQYVKKGNSVLVEGRLTCDPATGGPRVFTGQDGVTRATFEVNAEVVRFLTSKDHQGDHSGGQSQQQLEPTQGDFVGAPDDSIPF
jgi:single-strand DNA-binding protein